MIITPTSLTITQLFGSTSEQYVIPTYQRRYSWRERQVWELIDEGDTHLLGSIGCLPSALLRRLSQTRQSRQRRVVPIRRKCRVEPPSA